MLRHDSVAAGQSPPEQPDVRLQLAGDFELRVPEPVPLPHSVQRLVAFLALARRPVRRDRLGGALWGDVSQSRADGNARSALWRLGALADVVLERRNDCLAIAPTVEVDVWELAGIADALLDGRTPPVTWIKRLAAANEILPGWDDPWIVPERERFRQLRLHAIERAAAVCMRDRDFAQAITLGLAAVETEPYRESPHRLLVEAHINEGNAYEAARQYLIYRRLATEDLGVDPSPQMERLIDPVRSAVHDVDRSGARGPVTLRTSPADR